VAAANERGDLVLLDPAASASRDAARRIPEANSAPIYDMVANSPQTLAAACMSGRLVLWDTRLLLDGNRRPSLICASENGSLLSVAAHRARPYLFATGSANGVLETWDTRNYSSPLLSVVTHDAAIWSLSFLDTSSTQIVSCGEDGGLFLWEFNKDRRDPIQVEFSRAQQSNILVRRLHKAPLPLNVLACDLQTQTVLAGCDDDSLLVLRNA
jgi:WD40 repeat protein